MRNFCKSVLTFFCGRAITFIAPVSTQLLSALISSDILQRPAVALTWLNAALCFMVVLAYVATAVPGVTYPYLLEWMEGGTVDLIDRILAGMAIYAEPTLEHVAYIYPPFYYWVSSGVALLVGDQLLAARLVSLISTLVATAAIFWISRDALAACGFRDERNLYALLSAGLYLGCFELSGRWYHLARVDSLYLALLLTGFMLTRPRFGPVGSTAAGVMWACAFLTKQTAIVAMGPLLLSLLWIDLRRYLPAALACALIVSVSVLLLEFSTDGWFGYFVFELPRHHGLAIKVGTREFGLRDMLGQAAAATLAAALAGLMLPARLPARDWVPFWSFAFGSGEQLA